jgi:leucyl aminopeptidase
MEYSVKSGDPEKQRSACVVIGLHEGRKLTNSGKRLDEASQGALAALLRRGDIDGKVGQTLLLHNPPNLLCERLLLVGCGKEKEFHEGRYRDAISKMARSLADTGATEAVVYLTETDVKGRDIAWKVRQAVECTEAALYKFDRLKSHKQEKKRALRRLVLTVPKRSDLAPGETAVQQGLAISSGVALARDLGNLPGNICTPSYLADQARDLEHHYGIKVTVLEREDMEKLGMGALLSVARGSRQPPKLITLEYTGAAEGEPPVALVGKGLTFDAGGISIKPAANMDEMKYDMCGAASVLGSIKAAAELKLPINIVGVIPSSENLPDGDANKPGDIVTSMSGQTIEVLNTDAEGRLILCDALTYAERFKPAVVVDIATLTGACVIALGNHASGLMSNNDQLARELLNAGRYSWDRAWQLPLWDDYQKQLDSNFADMANIGGREAGAIIGGSFLARYTKKYKWAHLDIAGTAWLTGKAKGGTGRPVPLLTTWLIQRSQGAA